MAIRASKGAVDMEPVDGLARSDVDADMESRSPVPLDADDCEACTCEAANSLFDRDLVGQRGSRQQRNMLRMENYKAIAPTAARQRAAPSFPAPIAR